MSKHARERALERYNSELTKNDIRQMINIIQQNHHIPIYCSEDDPNMKFCYVQYHHIPYKVLYHNKGDGTRSQIQIITIYPFDPDEYNNALEHKKQKQIEAAITLLKTHGYIVYKRKNK